MTAQQAHNSGAFAEQARASEQAHLGVAAHEFSFNDESLFSSLEEDALLSSAPLVTSATASTTIVGTADDLFSSPEWTDPSPALTTSMSFNLDSCDTSPLLTDVHEAPELMGMPLFGDQINFPTLVQPTIHPSHPQDANLDGNDLASAKRSPQMAFNRVKQANEQSALLLLRAFNNQALINNSTATAVESGLGDQATASPAVILSPLPSAPLTASPVVNTPAHKENEKASLRGQKRRLDAADLLPLDAPIQHRSYKTPSATSRKSTGSTTDHDQQRFQRAATPCTPDVSLDDAADPLAAKRLSNTLAARRSRHRKAEELRQLHDTIEDLQTQVEMWKRRCLRAEQERDQILGQSS